MSQRTTYGDNEANTESDGNIDFSVDLDAGLESWDVSDLRARDAGAQDRELLLDIDDFPLLLPLLLPVNSDLAIGTSRMIRYAIGANEVAKHIALGESGTDSCSRRRGRRGAFEERVELLDFGEWTLERVRGRGGRE